MVLPPVVERECPRRYSTEVSLHPPGLTEGFGSFLRPTGVGAPPVVPVPRAGRSGSTTKFSVPVFPQ